MTTPTPAHDFGLLAANLARTLDRAITLLHGRHADPYEPVRSCTHDVCRGANRLLESAEKAAGRDVVDDDFTRQLAGYGEGIATCVLRHEGETR